ncbi:Gfo/Idh/MocA family protein [Jiangella asiatica]|uniref:Gfo/Idh/MocA family oxidoreductase n=1 Tax=Jiangella asiatica TaxID=2530372 RepID=A0A4R5CKV4_9ACTN|nr:Gfo/Idh/MocA family oxidoreductase [Jiangella asiatica]TDD99013.1 Gfo/Idh/MocA family oxidoreductase [Jiangella asiatica]
MGAPRIAVVGTGWWAASHHIPALARYDGAELVALCDPLPERAGELASRYGVPRVASSLAELIDDGGVDGVVVATPHATHHELARAALDAGLHVLVEKTMTTTAADAFDLVTAAEAAGLHLSVGYTYQYSATVDFAREAVRGEIGELVQVIAEFSSVTADIFAASGDSGTYSARLGGGQAHTQVTHVMGMVCWVTGREVSQVVAFTDHRGFGVDLDDVAAFRFDGGGTGVVASTGMGRQGIRHGVRYIGTTGSVDQDLLAARVVLHRADSSRVVRVPPASQPAYPTEAPARSFADLIAGTGPNRAPARPAAATVAFLETMLTAARTGRAERVPPLPPRPVRLGTPRRH